MSQSAKEVTEFLFPQLKETEDEKVKRELTRFLINFNNGYYSKPSENEIDFWIKWIDKKCEQNHTDEVKPKFNVGDWVVNKLGHVWHIDSFDKKNYQVSNGDKYNYFPISKQDEMHLWTINDAEDGDVLYFSDETIVIFKDLYNATTFHSYCHIEYGLFVVKDDMPDWWEGKGFQPATKEQRDFLFQKMKENGYEWDAEKKELNKIEKQGEQKPAENSCKKSDDIATEEKDMTKYKHGYKNGFECGKQLVLKYPEGFGLCWLKKQSEQKPTWSEEDEKMCSQVINEMEAIKSNSSTIFEKNIAQDKIDWLKSIKERVQPQPTSEWSEEDEKMISSTIEYLNEFREVYKNGAQECIKWLKLLKPNHWKPSEEQMEALFEAKLASINNREYFLGLLYEDLKKL